MLFSRLNIFYLHQYICNRIGLQVKHHYQRQSPRRCQQMCGSLYKSNCCIQQIRYYFEIGNVISNIYCIKIGKQEVQSKVGFDKKCPKQSFRRQCSNN